MNDEPTYEDLKNQITDLKRQIEFLRLNSTFENEEKAKRAAELIIANKELVFQNVEKSKRSEELIIANKTIDLQLELIIAIGKAEESEKKLRISENDFKRAQSIAHIGHWKWYLKTNEVEWSDEMFNIFGIVKNSYTGRLGDIIAKVIHPEDLHIVLPSNANEFSEKKPMEYRIILPDKSIRYIWAVAGETRFDENGKPIFLNGIAQDITERKHIEQSLKKSEEKYRLLSENITDGVAVFEDNKVKYVSEGYLKMFGYEKQEIENISFQYIFSFIYDEDKIQIKETIENAHKNQIKEFRYNYRVKSRTGEYIWVEDSINAEYDGFGNHFRSIIHSRNITDRKQYEQTLKDSEERWKFAIEGAGDGLWDWNLKTNEVYFSIQWKAMLGFEENEIHGSLKDWSNRVHPDDLQKCYSDIQLHLDGKVPFYSNTHRVLCKDGSYKWILDRGKIVKFNQNAEPVRMIGTHTDLTERFEIEKQLIQ